MLTDCQGSPESDPIRSLGDRIRSFEDLGAWESNPGSLTPRSHPIRDPDSKSFHFIGNTKKMKIFVSIHYFLFPGIRTRMARVFPDYIPISNSICLTIFIYPKYKNSYHRNTNLKQQSRLLPALHATYLPNRCTGQARPRWAYKSSCC